MTVANLEIQGSDVQRKAELTSLVFFVVVFFFCSSNQCPVTVNVLLE